MRKVNHRKSNTNTKTYVKNPKGKNHGERERDSTIIMAITMMFSGVLGFSAQLIVLLTCWKGSTIYACSVYWIRLHCPALFKYLTTYLRGG